MKHADLDILLQEGEGSMLEYKESISSPLSWELVAFANSAGGRILLGVRDDGSVKGIEDTNDLRAKIQDIARNCDPPVKILLERVERITVITVRESNENRSSTVMGSSGDRERSPRNSHGMRSETPSCTGRISIPENHGQSDPGTTNRLSRDGYTACVQ
jgi:predicted HTH transcriptional regulator